MAASDLLDSILLVDWTVEGIEAFLRETVQPLHSDNGCRFIERYDGACAWTQGIAFYSAGVNGTHHEFFTANDDECADTALLARRIIDESRAFPGWRKLELDVYGANPIRVRLYGGQYARRVLL